MNLSDLVDHVDQFQRRSLLDAVGDAMASRWIRKAAEYEAARHRPGIDYPGQASLPELRARWVALTEMADACRARAIVSLIELTPEVDDVLREAS